MVLQNDAIWPHMSIFNNVDYPLRVRRTPKRIMREKVEEVLDLVGLSGLERRCLPVLASPVGVDPYDVTLISVAVNTDLVPPEEKPRSWKDVLDPKVGGRLVISDPRGGGDGVVGGVEMTLGREWSSALAKQDVTIAEDGVASAGLDWSVVTTPWSSRRTTGDAIVQRQEGAQIKFLKLEEGSQLALSGRRSSRMRPIPPPRSYGSSSRGAGLVIVNPPTV